MARKPVILTVDDREDVRELVKGLLTPHSLDVAEASNGEEALLLLQLGLPDLIILDIMMPGIGGIETLKRIRELYGDTLPVFILTARHTEDTRLECMEAGADKVFWKPIDVERFMDGVKEVILGKYGKKDRPTPPKE